jgi:hypothetical protein
MNMKFKYIVYAIIFSSTWVFCQFPQIKDIDQHIEDAFSEVEGELTLYFLNAITGGPIHNANVKMNGVGEFKTDEEGKILFPIPEDAFAVIPVSFRANKFIKTDFDLELQAGTLFLNRFSISPEIDLKHIRIVLDWSNKPRDLDAHLVKKGGYHISYRNKKKHADGIAELDRDDMDGYGPETITVREISPNAVYEYYVHDYTHRSSPKTKDLSKKSNAVVKVYGEGKLLHKVRIPQDRIGNTWKVLEIRDRKILLVNKMPKK